MMPKFYVGQRIKKVRGNMAIGSTGNFAGPPRFDFDYRFDGHVFLDSEQIGTSGEPRDYGDIITSQWEPIAPPHQACDDAEFIASLDKLAQRVGEVA